MANWPNEKYGWLPIYIKRKLQKKFFIGFAASNFESIMGYTMKKLRKHDGLLGEGNKKALIRRTRYTSGRSFLGEHK